MADFNKEEIEKIRVLNLLMWMQASVYASDDCEGIDWFYRNQTKNVLKRAVDIIQKEHGPSINSLWDVQDDSKIMTDVTNDLMEFSEELASTPYWMLSDLTNAIRQYKKEVEEKNLKTINDSKEIAA
jgi:hypothetical protein